jgi:hypothetical protein
MPANQTIHDEPIEPDVRRDEEDPEEDVERLAADDEEGFGDDEVERAPPELEDQIREAREDLDSEEPDALARHALEVAVGNDE